MKKTQFFKHSFLNVILCGVTMSFLGCGVEAGNPDSKGNKLLRVYIAPTSYPDTTAVSAAIQRVNIINNTAGVTKSYNSSFNAFEIIPKSSPESQDATLGLTVERTDEGSFEKVELILAEDNPYLQLSLRSQTDPVFAAVIDDEGRLKNSLVFNTTAAPSNSSDILIDVELRKSLSAVTATQREQLQLPPQVQFVIQQKHSFVNNSEVGSIGFSNLTPGSLVCVFTGDTLPEAGPNPCTGSSFKAQIVSTDGVATVGSLAPGDYQTVNITSDNRVIKLAPTSVTAGEKALVNPN